MEVFLIRKGVVNAKGKYNEIDGSLVVLKGSVISTNVAGGTFRSAKTVIKHRGNAEFVSGNKVIKDICFKSPSSAANFVTGTSTNGLLSWKDKDGVSIKKHIEQ